MRTIVFGGLCGVPLILGNCQMCRSLLSCIHMQVWPKRLRGPGALLSCECCGFGLCIMNIQLRNHDLVRTLGLASAVSAGPLGVMGGQCRNNLLV